MDKRVKKALKEAKRLEKEDEPVKRPEKYYKQSLTKLSKVSKLLVKDWWVREPLKKQTKKKKSRRK
tara:strand:+ start:618 stop:815 length:198 start_codon:yes stop_codon:yes gene_type:complete